jgi:hypothetical protein
MCLDHFAFNMLVQFTMLWPVVMAVNGCFMRMSTSSD